jgi:LCP family protein required for cell wall assembly
MAEQKRSASGDEPPGRGTTERPYKIYRSRPRLLRLRRGDDPLKPPAPPQAAPREGRAASPRPRPRLPRLSPGRILKWLAIALAAWIGISAVLFMISAQIQRGKLADAVGPELDGGPYPLFGANTILVLGSDARPEGSKEPGAAGMSSRSDTIMLLRLGGGKNASLSIPRDTVVDIPGHGRAKINAAYAFGGAQLATRTVKQYLGIDVNHVVEVDFKNFPALIDAMGGITYRGGCVVSKINGGNANGGFTLRLRTGEHELNGKQALALARTRKNECNPSENDRTRARRQQKIVAAMKDKITSVETFVRLPWVSWTAPKAVRSDMAGPTLLGVAGAALTGGSGKELVLKPSAAVTLPDGGAALVVSDAEKRRETKRFLAG